MVKPDAGPEHNMNAFRSGEDDLLNSVQRQCNQISAELAEFLKLKDDKARLWRFYVARGVGPRTSVKEYVGILQDETTRLEKILSTHKWVMRH
jgi:hypothetical protein